MRFKIKGVKVEITFLFTALIAFILSLKAPSNVLITILSSLLHEAGHLLMMNAVGSPPEAVRLELTGFNIKRTSSVKISMKNEILIALGGPLINALIFGFGTLLFSFIKNETLLTFSVVNLILMTFNLLPIKRLDGGMLLYFILSRKFDIDISAKILKITSLFFIILIYLWGFYVFSVSRYNMSLLIIAIFLTFSMFGCEEY